MGNKLGKNYLLVNPYYADSLTSTGIDLETRTVAEALKIEVVQWSGSEGGDYGKEKWDACQIPAGKGYLIRVPNSQESLCRIVGADLEYRSGKDSALRGGADEMAWFRYAGIYFDNFLPTKNGNGCVVEINFEA